MTASQQVLGWDVGQRRLGVARAHRQAKIPQSLGIVELDGTEVDRLQELINNWRPETIVVGLPSGQQADWTRAWLAELRPRLEFDGRFVWQSETLTTVRARQLAPNQRRVDDLAACFILEDYFDD